MAYFLGGDFGGSTLASTISDTGQDYDPVYQDEVSAEFIWQLLPSAYRQLMDDREVFTYSWDAMIRAVSGLLLDTYQTYAAYSLRDVPVHQQRKWLRYEFIQEINFVEDPDLTVIGIQDRLEWDGTNFRLSGAWVNRRGHDKTTIALNGEADQDGSLSWSVEAGFDSFQAYSGVQFGYFNSSKRRAIGDAWS